MVFSFTPLNPFSRPKKFTLWRSFRLLWFGRSFILARAGRNSWRKRKVQEERIRVQMALTSWKHIETQSLLCTGLHESKWWKHQVLGNLVNESVKLSLSRFGAKHSSSLSLSSTICMRLKPAQKQVGSLNPKSFIMGSEFWIRSCFQEAFFKTATKQQLTCWWARWGGFFDSSFLRRKNTVPVYWPGVMSKNFQTPTSSSKQCHWLNLLRIN